MSISQSYFPSAQHVEVNGGSFRNIVINKNDAVSMILWPQIASSESGIFDSAARYAAGKCHPGTRQKMIEQMTDWIEEYDTDKPLLWLYGAAGAGKSALAHTICELLQQSYPDMYGGSFFFSSGATDRGKGTKLFATLAYQLAIHFPPFRKEINDALINDPSLPTKSMEIQLFYLITEPLLQCQTLLSNNPILIIDGLDECAEADGISQSKIIALIAQSIVDYNLPLRFMIASRPEHWIREAFDKPPLPNITHSISLRDDLDADKDIEAYLIAGFATILEENKRVMGSVALPWPSSKIIERFVQEASGQFVYASTVLKFVGTSSRFHSPQKQLQIITSRGPHRASAFSEIDALYAKILSVYPEWQTIKRILAAILLREDVPIHALQIALRLDHSDFVLALDALSSLIYVNDETSSAEPDEVVERMFDLDGADYGLIVFYHKSFKDFLRDIRRSGYFHIDLYSTPVPNEILKECFNMMYRNINQNYREEPSHFLNISLSTYLGVKYMITKFGRDCNHIDDLRKLATEMTKNLERFDYKRAAHNGMDSLFWFLGDLDPLVVLVDEARRGRILDDTLITSWNRLDAAISLARKRACWTLPLCSDFKVTPALVYLLEYHGGTRSGPDLPGLPIEQLSAIAGIGEDQVDATMRQYRHAVSLVYDIRPPFPDRYSTSRSLTQMCGIEETGWRTEGTWRDLRVMLARRSLKSFIDNWHQTEDNESYVAGLSLFFDTKAISDISTIGYFQSSQNVRLLAAINNLAAWAHERHLSSDMPLLSVQGENAIRDRRNESVLRSILFWINRQLANPQTVRLLKGHSETLVWTLTTLMDGLFEYLFRRPLLKHCSEISLLEFDNRVAVYPEIAGSDKEDYSDEEDTMEEVQEERINEDAPDRRSIKITALPLPLGLNEEETRGSCARHQHLWPSVWQPCHDKFFGQPNLMTNGEFHIPRNPLIDPWRWHPHLAFASLHLLVSAFYTYPGVCSVAGGDPLAEPKILAQSSLQYLTELMPYAYPTPENLNALRAIVYLYPQVAEPDLELPESFWASVAEHLHKYDRSILSVEELDLFLKWLNDEDHMDINEYVDGEHEDIEMSEAE